MTDTVSKIRFALVDLFLVIVAAIACVFWQEAKGLVKPFDVYPQLVCAALLILAFACLIQERLKASRSTSEKPRAGERLKTSFMIGGIALYIVCISNVGYFVSTFVYLVAMLQLGRYGTDDEFLETKFLISDSLVAGGVTTAIAIVFKLSLNLIFPSAWLF